MSPHFCRAAWALSLAGLLVLATGCDRAVPHPTPHTQLHITADGHLQLDHVPIELADLTRTLAGRQGNSPLMVEIHASPQADMQVVRQASLAIEAAHARLSFADEVPASDLKP